MTLCDKWDHWDTKRSSVHPKIFVFKLLLYPLFCFLTTHFLQQSSKPNPQTTNQQSKCSVDALALLAAPDLAPELPAPALDAPTKSISPLRILEFSIATAEER
ncbi:hypothetical protein BZA77DRAFT_389093 [Pyronema omphalodes]|nr:hypothetical protein BZA77DRAFT_389093 [Pyronema omphalodes]